MRNYAKLTRHHDGQTIYVNPRQVVLVTPGKTYDVRSNVNVRCTKLFFNSTEGDVGESDGLIGPCAFLVRESPEEAAEILWSSDA